MHYKFNYDYSKTLWMKMYLADPDFENNRSKVYINFESALEIIKAVDNMTQGIQKIIYLVGWQGLGHDDCYPVMEKVNDWLKRDCDADGKESLLWLIGEAKKYNTVVSFHGNVADAYEDSDFHDEFVAANALCNGLDGKPAVIEVFNGRNAYKTSYKQFWDSGLFKKIIDRFCAAVPVREAGTVHLDNFCLAESLNPQTFIEEQDEARNKMLDYLRSLGIDVTTEGNWREAHFRADSPDHPIRKLYETTGEPLPECKPTDVPMRVLGKCPAVWWLGGMSIEECVNTPPSVFSGCHVDSALKPVFYRAMHGEDIWRKYGNDPKDWGPAFLKEFCTCQLPYFYLSRYQCLRYEENAEAEGAKKYTVYFSEDVVTRAKDLSISKNGIVLKQGNDVILPLTEENKTFIAYSENGRSGKWNMPDAVDAIANLYEITVDGNRFIGKMNIVDGQIELNLTAGQAVAIHIADE